MLVKVALQLALLAITCSTLTNAVPIERATAASPPSDVDILQYALTLEHLENAFYTQFLSKFSSSDFATAGYPSFLRGRMNQIGQHEAQHVTFISNALNASGVTPTSPCVYDFSVVADVKSFVATAEILEGVGVTAYLGAAQFIKNPVYLTAAGSILTTEARHNAWLSSVGQKAQPWTGPQDTPQTLNEVFSLAAPFIKSCPSTNPTLPVKAFPSLTVSISQSGSSASLTFDSPSSSSSKLSLALLRGLSTTFLPISSDKTVTLPEGLQGTVYAVVTSDDKAVTDDSTVAGPAILKFEFPSFVDNLV